jgi:hypothetical protein
MWDIVPCSLHMHRIYLCDQLHLESQEMKSHEEKLRVDRNILHFISRKCDPGLPTTSVGDRSSYCISYLFTFHTFHYFHSLKLL